MSLFGLRSFGGADDALTTFAKAKERAAQLEAEYEHAGRALKALSGGGPMNMTPDRVRATPEWKKAKHEADAAFAALRSFNAVYVRRFKREIAQERRRGRSIEGVGESRGLNAFLPENEALMRSCRTWMRRQKENYRDPKTGEINYTKLAEECAYAHDADQLLDDQTGWIWDLALENT